MSTTAVTTNTATLPPPPATRTPRASTTGAPAPAPAAGGGGGGPPPAPGGCGGPPPPGGGGPGAGAGAGGAQFALTPATYNTTVLDYSRKADIYVYNNAVKPLSDDVKFDTEPGTLRNFLKRLATRSEANGWTNGILDIPDDPAMPLGPTTNILTNYGQIELEHLRACVNTYITTQTRVAQDSIQLYTCIMASLTTEAIDKVTTWENEYTVQGLRSGVLLLKVFI